MAQGGEAAGYYNDPNNKSYPTQQQPYQQPQYGGPQYMPPPPTYQQNFGQWSADQKPTFDQAFKIDKPRWNDLWAGILLILVFAGFVAVSGISLQGYTATKGFNGGGIYDSSNDFGLSTNTIVLFVFCLAVALVLGYGYISLARIFTKQFICKCNEGYRWSRALTLSEQGSPASSTSSGALLRLSTCCHASTGPAASSS
jgi:hypothetical protein